MLKNASMSSFRTKRQEAAVRIIDHAKFFTHKDFDFVRIPFDNKVNHVNVILNIEIDAILSASTKIKMDVLGNYSKREEASIRLKDHLIRFKSISSVGDRLNNK